ncbi:hypothetical protein AXX12_00840 [Anaerosporomusa subterranea]|uniref:DUF3298 domain-containing protein n=1 Tax=Anaerosporomusa subterranea TaxID=1794912 RepID=A0A154BVS3_ANASB|nr:DUF3298 and DUF4163 domain-containing protein [Anaerosporomusa subterranea]KYZ78124.1 hypothetical protein AXX12_00840 [Anaerosporomusa subterranea]
MKTLSLRLFLQVLLILLCFFPSDPVLADPREFADITQQTIRDGIIDIEYPVVKGLDNSVATEKINSLLSDHVARFRAGMAEDPYVKQAVGRYVIHQNADGILSLTITQYHYSGGAHGMSTMQGYTFDLATGYLYQFTDLIPPWERDRINRTIKQQIADKKTPLLQPFTEIKREPDFYLMPDRKIVIFYQLYELAPYAWGFVRFPIEY